MIPHITIDSPRYTGPGDYRYGTLVCWDGGGGKYSFNEPELHHPQGADETVLREMVFACLTRCDYGNAAKNGNPDCDPTRPWGHLPRGVFEVGMPLWQHVRVLDGDEMRADDHDGMIAKYTWERMGPVFIPLLPVTLTAATVEMWDRLGIGMDYNEVWKAFMLHPERSGLGIHGGPLLDDHLRATYGCTRLFDDDAIAVAKWREKQEGTIYLIHRGMIE